METLQVPSELADMVALYRERKPRRVLEIGCWDGGTLKVWLEDGAPELVAAVDLEHRNAEAYEPWRKPATRLELFTGNSQGTDAAAFVATHAPYDWAFIDGDHSATGVRSDWDMCRPHVRPGGLVLLHDITPPDFMADYPPGLLLNELESSGLKVWRYQDLTPAPWARGIGVVQL